MPNQFRRWAIVFISLFFILFYVGWVHPEPYGFFIAFGVLSPWAAVLSRVLYPSYVRFNAKKQSPEVHAEFFLLPGACLLGMRAILDWHIWDWDHFWAPFAILTILFVGAVIKAALPDFEKKRLIFPVLLFGAAYSAGAVVCLDGYLDHHPPQRFETRVLEKRDQKGRYHAYFMKFSIPGLDPAIKEYKVDRYSYGQKAVGDPITFCLGQGALNIPYYYVR
jgi:hypothetical protein